MSTSERVFNFSPGPAVLPLAVLEQVQKDLVCLPGYGMSILEMSHRAKGFIEVLESAKSLLTELLSIPKNYKIAFMQGGSRLQFSMVPMNLLRGSKEAADYLITGSWSKYALAEAKKEGEVKVVWDGKATNYDHLPAASEFKLNPSAPYLYYCSNETIQGVQYHTEPASGDVPLVCDASSDFLYRPLPIEKYGIVYACAQKNAGPAGVTTVIIREDLLAKGAETLPGYLHYNNHVTENSLWNTPPTFAIYVMNLVLKWLKNDIGGLTKMHEINRDKAKLVYDEIDSSGGFYRGHAHKDNRSLMNATFRLPSEELEKKFVAEGAKRKLDGLAGHRSVGGIRASIYNAMPQAGVLALRDFMKEFRESNSDV